eukprot:CAMPEP_0197418998 /NCGR_PEP_ID=MMETSP1170-20131217/4533_1 /TAXON_ID=54406 /ORGANISM="Sarcinochrysis sp, Strain CCMP770" /LENGTH=51 /DNA_ID=CAMNT_0042946075 /DNA_START=1 /DNA_END=153 /DNA_ORIENTATION=-
MSLDQVAQLHALVVDRGLVILRRQFEHIDLPFAKLALLYATVAAADDAAPE